MMPRALTKLEALALQDDGPPPQCYRAIAVWLRAYAEESANPEELLKQAASQDALAADMEADPAYYARKPTDLTDWLWMQRRALKHASQEGK